MTSPKKVTNALALELIDAYSIEKVLYLNLSTFGLFQEISLHGSVEINKWDEKSISDDFDLIVADLPLGMGAQFFPCIDYNLVNVDGKDVLVVKCKPSQEECYLDGNDFYIRVNPASEKLEGKKLVDYIRQRKSQWGDYSF